MLNKSYQFSETFLLSIIATSGFPERKDLRGQVNQQNQSRGENMQGGKITQSIKCFVTLVFYINS